MLIQEMHNKVELRLQKMGSHVYDWIQPEQLDSYINDNILGYIKNKVNSDSMSNKGPLDKNLKNMDDVQTLVVNKELALNIKNNNYFQRLPNDYLFFVEATVGMKDLCGEPAPAKTNAVEFTHTFDIPLNTLRLSLGGNILYQRLTPLTDPSLKFMLHNDILRLNPLLSFNPFTSRYNIFNNAGNLSIVTGEVVEGNLTETSISIPPTGITRNRYNFTPTSTPKIRILRKEEANHYTNHPFAKSSVDSPYGVISSQEIEVYGDKRFILNKLYMTYVRKPNKVNLSLNVSCDLPEHTHEEIIDRTVLDILETIESQRLNSKLSINTLNE